MLKKINIYIFKRFFFLFLITLITFSSILFIGDFVEQFRKSTGKEVPIGIVLQLSALNFPNLILFTLPIVTFFGSLSTYLLLIRNSEMIVIGSAGISNLKISLPAVLLYFLIGIFFVVVVNPFISIFDKRYSELEYRYIDRVDKFASITKNGLWLKQENEDKQLASVLYAGRIKDQGKVLEDFMVLEYDTNGTFQGRLDGKRALLIDGYWEMNSVQITPKYGQTLMKNKILYKTNIRHGDITDSLSSPTSISIWRLLKFINFLESLGYSAIDFKMHLYNLAFLPILMASLVLFSSSMISNLKQNDKFISTIIYSLIFIFLIYFLSSLFDALGKSGQLHPFIARGIIPFLVIIFSIILFSIKKNGSMVRDE